MQAEQRGHCRGGGGGDARCSPVGASDVRSSAAERRAGSRRWQRCEAKQPAGDCGRQFQEALTRLRPAADYRRATEEPARVQPFRLEASAAIDGVQPFSARPMLFNPTTTMSELARTCAYGMEDAAADEVFDQRSSPRTEFEKTRRQEHAQRTSGRPSFTFEPGVDVHPGDVAATRTFCALPERQDDRRWPSSRAWWPEDPSSRVARDDPRLWALWRLSACPSGRRARHGERGDCHRRAGGQGVSGVRGIRQELANADGEGQPAAGQTGNTAKRQPMRSFRLRA